MSAQRFIFGNLVLLLAYVAGGKLGMLFALPPGYSIPVFPPRRPGPRRPAAFWLAGPAGNLLRITGV